MEDNYNIFGNFENLSSVNIAKKLNLVPPANKAPTKETIETEEDFLLDIEKDILEKKSEKVLSVASKKSSVQPLQITKPKENESTEPNSLNNSGTSSVAAANEQSVARRTRSSRRASLEPASANASVSGKTTNKRQTAKKNSSNTNTAINQNIVDFAMGLMNTTRPKRGRKNTRGTSNSNNAMTPDQPANESLCSSNENGQIIENGQRGSISNGSSRNVMRARRNYIAERAARCTTVDFVDLITSPLPRVEGVIDVSLDSDDENEKLPDRTTDKPSALLETSFDEDNPEISVKIVWDGLPEVFPLRKYQKFKHIFEQLAERAKTEEDKVFLNLDNKIISPNDTPASINYKIFQFIYGRAMIDPKFLGVSAVGKKKRDRNLLVLKVQSDKWKRPLSLELHKTEKFKQLIIKCAEELKMPYEKVKLSFDGEPLQHDQTPTDLDFEGGEILEIHLKDNA